MSLKIVMLFTGIAITAGLALGYYLRILVSLGKKGSMELQLKQMELAAQNKEKQIIDEAERKAGEILQIARAEIKEKENENKKNEDRLIKKDELLDHRQTEIDREVEEIKKRIEEIKGIREEAQKIEKQKRDELEAISRLSTDQAKEELLNTVEKQFEEDILARLRKLEQNGREKLESKARDIIATAIQRLSSAVSSDMLTTHVTIPNDEIKGKIIGKEGRNIKSFERATGVEVIVDDTPGSITISSFDPVRRQVAKMALEKLIADGRIQPAKIEEFVQKAEQDINKTIKEIGQGQRPGFRRPDPSLHHGPARPGGPAGEIPVPFPTRFGGRIPGHQPRPISLGETPGGAAKKPLCRRR
jgi:ribonuclease Y